MSTPFVIGSGQESGAASNLGPEQEFWTEAGAVRGPLPRTEADVEAERDQATIADPIPLGLAGFAAATFTISTVYAGWFGPTAVMLAIGVALVYGGIGQFLAGMWAFARGNILAATAFATFGSFNMAWAVLQIMSRLHTLPATTVASGPTYVEGIFVITFGFISWYLAIAALGVNRVIAAVLAFLGLAYLCDGIGTWIFPHHWLLSIGGYAGMVSSLLAVYVAAADRHRQRIWP